MARLSVGTRLKIVILHQKGLSQTKISKETGVSRCAVQALLKKYKETGNVEDRRSSGRPRKLSAADERLIMLTSLRNQKMSSSDISSELAVTSGTLVHPSTVRRSLARSGLHGRIVDRKPYLGRGNKAKQVTGKKSIQTKEEKQKREEERAAMTAVYAKVQAANQLADPLETFSVFKKYDRNGLNLTIKCSRVTDLDQKTIDWAVELTKKNMRLLYDETDWVWKQKETEEELTDERAWYLVARDENGEPVGFVHFRFDVECGDEVLYCYDVQLEVRVRRKGLGKCLVQILLLMANSTQMKKVILTVFKHNLGAYRFFRNGLQFEIDETSPSVSGCCGEDCTYEILSRRTKFGDAPHSHSALCAGCLPLNEEANEDGEES